MCSKPSLSGKYKAAFLLPKGTNKTLGEDGWMFESDDYLPMEIKSYLVNELRLTLLESYLGINAYINDNMKMSVINDEKGHIENISFQLYKNSLNTLLSVFQAREVALDSELFVPEREMSQ